MLYSKLYVCIYIHIQVCLLLFTSSTYINYLTSCFFHLIVYLGEISSLIYASLINNSLNMFLEGYMKANKSVLPVAMVISDNTLLYNFSYFLNHVNAVLILKMKIIEYTE